MRIHFVLVGEGSSDDGIIPHLENLCIDLGADEVTGTAVDFQRLGQAVGHSSEAKLRAAIQLEPVASLFIIHRDADQPDPQPRYGEIAGAAAAVGLTAEWAAMVPVQETEAWLLLDERAIRTVAGKPHGRTPLNLPRPSQVESIANPKERLQEALLIASEKTGRKRERVQRKFADQRRILLQRLPINGSLQEVESWTRLRRDLAAVLSRLR